MDPDRHREDIAICGMSCMFPGADSLERFWQNIVGKVDCISEAPPDWQPELFFDETGADPDKSYSNRGGFLGDLSRFDPTKYGVVPRSVDGAEPDHFIALRCAFEALADAGVPELSINRERTGVIIGRGLFVNRGWVSVFQRTFVVDQVMSVLRRIEPDRSPEELDLLREELKRNLPPASAESVPGLVHSAMVGRIANRLDLRGPAYTVDAACSSALVAVEHGMRELREGTCDAVLVGGSQVSTPAPVHVLFCHLGALSRAGKIAPFSADAQGTVLGQGCGLLVLKRRSDAERDGNRIYALLKGVGISSDGKGAGLLAPLSEGQQLSIRRAYERSGLSPSTIELVEAHGTGIPLGDATEFHTLECAFGSGEERGPIALGTIKSMIGHLIPASGAASLIKTALALYHRVLPPTLHAEERNADLAWEGSGLFLVNEPRPWLHGDRATPRRAGVNAFGFGGINAHAILEEHARDEAELPRLERRWPVELVVVSAADREALARRVHTLAAWIEAAPEPSLLDVAASCAREDGAARIAIVAKDADELVLKLRHAEKLLADRSRDRIQDKRGGIFWFERPLAREGRTAFLFPGEGAQYPNMMHELCRHFPEVRRQFDLTASALRERGLTRTFGEILFPQPSSVAEVEGDLYGLEAAVASVTAAGRGLLDLLRRLKVAPDAIVGHSSGEFGALLAAGVYKAESEEAGIRSIVAGAESARELERSRLVPGASLVSVGGADPEAVRRVVAEAGGELLVAMDNCPGQVVIAGTEHAIDRAVEALRGKGGLVERLQWDRAYHTPQFLPACSIVDHFYATFELHPPDVELWSCATAARYPSNPAEVKELAVRQWRSPVRFRETVLAMHDAGVRLFVEVGPRGNLSAFVSDTLRERDHAAIPMDVHRTPDLVQLCRAVGLMAAHGLPVDLASLYEARRPELLDLASPAPAAARVDPPLRLEFPVLEVGDEVAAKLASAPAAARTPEAPRRPPAAARPSAPAASGNGHEGAAPPPTAAPRVPPDSRAPAAAAVASGERDRAFADFQRTMQRFLEMQQRMMAAAAGAPGAAPAPPPPVASKGASAGAPSTGRAPKPNGSPQPPASGRARAATAPSPAAPAASGRGVPAPAATAAVPRTDARPYRFLQRVLEHRPGERVVAECELDLDECRFLADHTFFGRGLSVRDPELRALPIMPLAMTLEAMAEAAAFLSPDEPVVAVSDIVTSKWLAFETPTRRIRIVAERDPGGSARATVLEADREGMSAEIARATVELASVAPDLGPARLAPVAEAPPDWDDADTYRILYHGPAFQGIQRVERHGPGGLQARVRVPDPALLFARDGARELCLPVVLVDNASQLPGMANNDVDGVGASVTLAFPNTTERLEFVPGPELRGPLVATVRYEQDASTLRSDVEMTTEDGRVVLRYSGRVEEIVRFPAGLYHYKNDPRRARCSADLAPLFAGVPGIEDCAVVEAARVGEKVLVHRHWSRVAGRMVLSRDEARVFERSPRPPVVAAGWLLGRIAAKDAVRTRLGAEVCLADVTIDADEHGRPRASGVEGADDLGLSLSHAGFEAVAVASRRHRRVGIDVEPLRELDPLVLADSFTTEERALLDRIGCAPVVAWTAKEALGKALGRGLPGGGGAVTLLRVEREGDGLRFEARLAGALADAWPELAGREDLAVHSRNHRGHALSLCLVA